MSVPDFFATRTRRAPSRFAPPPGGWPAVPALAPPGGGGAGLGIDQHHVRDVDRSLGLDDPADLLRALGVPKGARAGVGLLHVHALDIDALALWVRAQDPAGLAAVLARDHLDGVVLADLHRHLRAPPVRARRS